MTIEMQHAHSSTVRCGVRTREVQGEEGHRVNVTTVTHATYVPHMTRYACYVCDLRGEEADREGVASEGVTHRYIPLRAVMCRYVPLRTCGVRRPIERASI